MTLSIHSFPLLHSQKSSNFQQNDKRKLKSSEDHGTWDISEAEVSQGRRLLGLLLDPGMSNRQLQVKHLNWSRTGSCVVFPFGTQSYALCSSNVSLTGYILITATVSFVSSPIPAAFLELDIRKSSSHRQEKKRRQCKNERVKYPLKGTEASPCSNLTHGSNSCSIFFSIW